MIISNCNDWNSFEFYGKNLFCAENAKLIDGICVVEKEDNDAISKYLALLYFAMIPVWFVSSILYFVFGKRHKKLIAVTLVIIGILWIIGILANYIPVSFG